MNEKTEKLKAPFPYFGGKRQVAGRVWAALGDCGHYIEPLCGSCAVLLARPGWDPQRYTETINDADGHIANVWRSLQARPDEVARWCDWPVNHADLIARKRTLNAATESLLERLCADPEYCDPKLAGYYIWAASCWIGHGLIRPNQRPQLSDTGTGVHARGQRPNVGDAGKGVHAKGQIPQSDAGHGADVRDPYNTNIYSWFRRLSERLRYVRVVCGDWKRVCGGDWQDHCWKSVGMFFDPPYSDKANRDDDLYAVESSQVAHEVRQWCLERGDRPTYRIVLAGYYEEHEELLSRGWTVQRWKTSGGYGNIAHSGETQGNRNRFREALFLSPHCIRGDEAGSEESQMPQ